ncbi:MAG: hypothetical protein ACI4HQ_07465 [Acetatifactor sp.]
MKVFAEQKILSAGIFAGILLSITVKMLLGFLYDHMIKEADSNMASTNNRLLRQCKVKFSNCYELNNGVSNIPVFVDKFLCRMALGPFSFETLYHMSGQLMLLSVVLSGVGVCRSIVAGRTLGEILPFYIVSFAGLYLYFSVSSAADIKGKRRMLKVNLVDYLENHLSPRIHVTRKDMEMLYGNSEYAELAGKGRKQRGVQLMPIGSREQTGDMEKETVSTAVSEEELEALLKEFLTG